MFASVAFFPFRDGIDAAAQVGVKAVIQPGGSIRDEEVIIAHDDTVIATGDHVILFLVDKKHIRDVEKLFHVGLSFF